MRAHGKLFDVDDDLYIGPEDLTEEESSSSSKSESKQASRGLNRTLSWLDGFCIVYSFTSSCIAILLVTYSLTLFRVGIIIGSGIFSSPGVALARAGSSVGLVLLSWTFSGVLVLLASQCYFELNGLYPSAGGDYTFLQQAYGDYAGFAFGFYNFFISKPGSQAIIATIFGRYMNILIVNICGNSNSTSSSDNPFGEETTISKVSAVALNIILTLLNCYGLKESTLVQKVLTFTKIFLVVCLFIMGLVYISNSNVHIINSNVSLNAAFRTLEDKSFIDILFLFFSSLIPCLWAFDGWAVLLHYLINSSIYLLTYSLPQDMFFMTEELVTPSDIVTIVGIGVLVCTTIYIMANFAYCTALTASEIVTSKAIAYDFGTAISADLYQNSLFLPTIFVLGVAIATAGSNNGSIMAGGRALYAFARAKQAPDIFAKLNKVDVPANALLLQCVWGCVLLLLPGSGFSSLLDFFGPCSWFFYAATSSSVIMLRHKFPDKPRPFKVYWYPLPIIIVDLLAAFIVLSNFVREPLYVSIAFIIVFMSIPVKYITDKYYPDSRDSNDVELSNITATKDNGRSKRQYNPLITADFTIEEIDEDEIECNNVIL